ncbi:hypothetical protein LLEC1_05653 [Akanthomyces lecanii]|uniref:Aminoglycoside phosphotransferase domain-containing protein n=1 Tax=Cordyceps confragosa TaxID=2714763 RepID=A0A179IEN9_CORDF|nr:hypothetical protein LLEC1_05653 [Akanthomyces lecanii]
MLGLDVIRALLSVWTSATSFLLNFWRRVTYETEAVAIDRPVDKFPASPQAIKEAADAFVQSLQTSAVEALASRYNENKACKVLRRLHGSFNVCYFVEFEDGARKTIRIPITPRLHTPWEKLQSEVATLNYLRAQTSIPVPTVCAFGKDAVLTSDATQNQMFLISEYIAGVSLMPDQLANADEITRKRFFLQLFDYLAQLRSLEFQKIGSLMPGISQSPWVGNIISFSSNSLRIQLPSFISARDYMASQYNILRQHISSPVADLSESDSRYELFALHALQGRFESYSLDPELLDDGPFVLHHADLHLCNILVDADLNIQGIIDWEFVNTVPLRLFTPPLWAIHQEPGLDKLSYSFFMELFAAAHEDSRFERLFCEWYGKGEFNEAFHLARMIRHPTAMAEVFAEGFAKKLFANNIEEAEAEFFSQNPEAAIEATRLATQNSRWTQHLKDTGWYELEK